MNPHQYPSRAIVMVLLATTAATVMAGALVGPILPQINAQFHDMERVSMLLTLPALGVICMAPFVGKLVQKIGKKPLLLAALLLYAAAGSSGLWLDTLPLLLVGRFALGMSMAMIMTLSSTLIADLSSGKGRDKLMARQAMAIHIGAISFVSLSGYLAHIDWRAPFAVYLLSLVILVAAYFALPNESKHIEFSADHKAAKIDKSTWHAILPLYGLAFLSMAMFYLIPVFYAFIVADVLNGSASQIGNSLAIFSVVGAIASLQMPKLAQTLSTRRLLALAFLLYAVGHMCLAGASTWAIMIIGGSLTGAAYGLSFPAISKAIAGRSSLTNRATLMSGFVTAYYLGQFATPVFGKTMITTDMQSLFYVSGSVMLMLSVGLLAYKTKQPMPADT